MKQVCSGGSKICMHVPLPGPIVCLFFFNFHAVLGQIVQITGRRPPIGFTPLWEILDLPLAQTNYLGVNVLMTTATVHVMDPTSDR